MTMTNLHYNLREKRYYGICLNCGKFFERPYMNVRQLWKKGRTPKFCSQDCSGKYTSPRRKKRKK